MSDDLASLPESLREEGIRTTRLILRALRAGAEIPEEYKAPLVKKHIANILRTDSIRDASRSQDVLNHIEALNLSAARLALDIEKLKIEKQKLRLIQGQSLIDAAAIQARVRELYLDNPEGDDTPLPDAD